MKSESKLATDTLSENTEQTIPETAGSNLQTCLLPPLATFYEATTPNVEVRLNSPYYVDYKYTASRSQIQELGSILHIFSRKTVSSPIGPVEKDRTELHSGRNDNVSSCSLGCRDTCLVSFRAKRSEVEKSASLAISIVPVIMVGQAATLRGRGAN